MSRNKAHAVIMEARYYYTQRHCNLKVSGFLSSSLSASVSVMLRAAVTAAATSLTTVIMTTVLAPRAGGTPKERWKEGGREG